MLLQMLLSSFGDTDVAALAAFSAAAKVGSSELQFGKLLRCLAGTPSSSSAYYHNLSFVSCSLR